MLNRIKMTSSSPKMFPNSRSESDSTREKWLMISMGSMIGAMKSGAPGGAAKCLTYGPTPCSLMPWIVVVDPHRDRAAERDVDAARRCHQPRDEAAQVRHPDEQRRCVPTSGT